MKHWVKVAFLPRGRARKKFGGFGNLGVSTDFGCIFMYFYAFNTGMYSFGGLNPETSQILPCNHVPPLSPHFTLLNYSPSTIYSSF